MKHPRTHHETLRRERLRGLGVCTICRARRPLAPGNRTRCAQCARDNANLTWSIRQARRDQGLCTQCYAPAEEGRSCCIVHLVKARDYQRKTLAARRERGVCTTCGDGAAPRGALCNGCRAGNRERKAASQYEARP